MKLTGRYLTLTPKPGGMDVSLTLAGVEELADNWEKPDFSAFAVLFEDFAANGWTMLSPEDIGALTSCQIIISWDVEMDSHGFIYHVGDTYWHERYQVEDAIEQLLAGELFLQKAG